MQAMWMMLQQEKPDDFVVATGETHSVRELVETAFQKVNKVIRWEGEGVEEVGIEEGTDIVRVRVNPKFYRPVEVLFHAFRSLPSQLPIKNCQHITRIFLKFIKHCGESLNAIQNRCASFQRCSGDVQ